MSQGLRIVYSPHYNITLFGLERFHPFDSRKYGRALQALRGEFHRSLSAHLQSVDRPASDQELSLAHAPEYLAALRHAPAIAQALELPFLRFAPAGLLRWRILRPMLWAVRGSVLAARSALANRKPQRNARHAV